MKQKSLLLISAISFLLSSCSTMPSYVKNLPSKKGYIYTVGTGLEPDMQDAITEAESVARGRLAQEIDIRTSGTIKRVGASVNNSDAVSSFRTGITEVYSENLSGVKTIKQDIDKEGGNFRAYVLLSYDEGAAVEKLLARIKADKKLNDAIRTTELYKELERDIEAYRQDR
jgi:hypothetical protein|tara:strand:- start:2004 stop:2516 length:513 start_codon:yes stop_codon:yes gene_type:complete